MDGFLSVILWGFIAACIIYGCAPLILSPRLYVLIHAARVSDWVVAGFAAVIVVAAVMI
jgi:hypothetical protein